MSKKDKQGVAEIKLLVDGDGKFHVETAVFNDDMVSPQDLVNMMGRGVWDVITKSLWPVAAENAKKFGVTDDKWDEFVEKMAYLVGREVEQFTLAVIAAATAPLAFSGDNALEEFEELFKFVDEFVTRHQESDELFNV